jgi:hypothetical protein
VGKIGRIKMQRIGIEEIPHMVERRVADAETLV